MNHLALQVAVVHHVIIYQAKTADARGGQVHGQGRTKTAGTNQQDTGCLKFFLAGHAHFRHDQMAAVALDFLM